MYKSIIFDVDGTLIDTQRATILALNKVLKEETGNCFANNELRFALGIPGEVSLPKFGVNDVHTANMKWNAYLYKYSKSIKVYPGIVDIILRLNKMGILLGIVTSNTKYELKGLLNYFLPFRLMDYISFAVCADDTKRHKPHAEPLLKFLEISGSDPSKTIYIGDTVYDMNCAKAADVDFGLALWGAVLSEEIKTDFSFNSPYEILRLLKDDT